MRRRATSLGFAILIALAVAACAKSDANSVDIAKQVNQVQAALGQARSWHVSSSFALGPEVSQIEEDVGCPFNYHRVGKFMDGRRGLPDEILATQQGYYYRQDDQWSVLHPPPNDYCKDGPSAGAYPLARSLEVLKTQSTLKRGELKPLEGASCREFEFIGSASPHLSFGSMCIDEQTNLPYEYRHGADVHQYSKWNEPVTLEPPAGL
jgi:hypothetical protein